MFEPRTSQHKTWSETSFLTDPHLTKQNVWTSSRRRRITRELGPGFLTHYISVIQCILCCFSNDPFSSNSNECLRGLSRTAKSINGAGHSI